jgi:hypothetical protein
LMMLPDIAGSNNNLEWRSLQVLSSCHNFIMYSMDFNRLYLNIQYEF